MKLSRRLMSAVQAGMLGAVLVAGAGACTSTGGYDIVGGNESTADVCDDLGNTLPPLVGSVATSALTLGLYPDPTPDQQAREVEATRASFTQLSRALRVEAGNAGDDGLTGALVDTADGVDAQAAKIRTVDDIASIDSKTVDTSKLDPYCPDLRSQLGG